MGRLVLRNTQHRLLLLAPQHCLLASYRRPQLSYHRWRACRVHRQRVLAQSGGIEGRKTAAKQWQWAAATVVENRYQPHPRQLFHHQILA